MAFEICTPAGERFAVHTEVGEGLTQVVVQQLQQREPVAVEPQDDAS